jgi:hypothetical protein
MPSLRVFSINGVAEWVYLCLSHGGGTLKERAQWWQNTCQREPVVGIWPPHGGHACSNSDIGHRARATNGLALEIIPPNLQPSHDPIFL